jgi:uncharacterized protein YcaQ
MLPFPIKLNHESARRFHRRALRFDDPCKTVGEALEWHGYIQIDPINVCGRMHDLILRNRVSHYSEGDLFRYMHCPDHFGFEHYFPGSGVLVAMPAHAWPYLIAGMRQRRSDDNGYSGRMNFEQARLAKRILEQITTEGPLSSDAIEHDGKVMGGWGLPSRAAKIVLDKLFFHGRVLIRERRNFRRIYDLPDRVLEPDILNTPEPNKKVRLRWTTLTKIRQRRLVSLTPAERDRVEDMVQPFEVEGCSILYGLRSDCDLLDQPVVDETTLLVAPLDPLIYDRRLTSKLWDLNYTWEVYKPREKRVRGYYALPLLSRTSFVGHVDLKADRKTCRLNVVSKNVRRGHRYASARAELATFLGLK